MTHTVRTSLQHYWRITRLRAVGCPVEYPSESENTGQLRIKLRPNWLGTDLYQVAEGTAIAVWLDIRTVTAITLYQFSLCCPAWGAPISWCAPSAKHEGYYRIPPDLWIGRSRVLNRFMDAPVELPRNGHLEGFLLGVLPQAVPPNAGQELEALIVVEDLRGDNHMLPVALRNRPLDPAALRYSEAALFPPAPPPPPAVPNSPAPRKSLVDYLIEKGRLPAFSAEDLRNQE